MNAFAKTVSGLIVPRKYVYSNAHGIQCGFCSLHIFKEHEAGGIIHYKEGKPICARDRILQGKMGATIVGDKPKREAHLKQVEERIQKEADHQALVVADKTQTQTRTKRLRK